MKIFILIALSVIAAAPSAFAKSQTIFCVGLYQEGILSIENKVVKVKMNNDSDIYSVKLTEKTVNKQDGTVTFAQKRGPVKVTIPENWLNKNIERFSKHDDERGYQIKEQVRFVYDHVNEMDYSLLLSECESWITR